MKKNSLCRAGANLALALATVAAALPSHAQPYPSRPVRFIVPFGAGGAVDIMSRAVGQKLSEQWNQPVIVDNRPGAGGNLGAELAARAAPDGYTLVLGDAAHAIGASLYKKLSYDFARDFAPITLAAVTPLTVVVHPSIPAASVRELIQLARSKKGQIHFGSGGSGSSTHLAGEMFKILAAVDLVHVPYKGVPAAVPDLLSGQVSVVFLPLPVALPHLRSNRIRALAITTATRSPALPDLPTVAESGITGYDASTWYGMMVPTGTPRVIVDRLHRDITAALRFPEINDRLTAQGARIVASTPAEFAAHIRSEIAKWAKVVQATGARVE